ncbi:MAG: hypothetical protein P8075_06785 [Deltaproteobacteria bacterium]
MIEAPCLDCGDPLRVVVREGVIEDQDPSRICTYVDIPIRDWSRNLPRA